MMILVTGGSKSGKSRIAESLLSGCAGRKIYLATMEPFGSEAARAIERHRKARAGKGFETVEKPRDLHEITLPRGSAVLLECLSTLCANEMFSAKEPADPTEKILRGIDALEKQTERLIVVTSNVGCDGIAYPPETMEYIRVLGGLNQRLARRSEAAVEAVCGIPVTLKGALP